MSLRIEAAPRRMVDARKIALVLGAGVLVLALWFVSAGGLPPAPGVTSASSLDSEMLRVAKGLYCPVCPSTPLDVCDTQACVQWRALIREKLAAGQSEQQIRAYFVEQYGERVLGAPPAEGFNLGAYALPLLALVAGLAFLYGWLRSQRAALAPPQPAPATAIAPEYAERIAQALEEEP